MKKISEIVVQVFMIAILVVVGVGIIGLLLKGLSWIFGW